MPPKRKQREPELVDDEVVEVPAPTKKKKPSTPAEKDAEFLENPLYHGLTDEEILDKQKTLKWRSDIYKHFTDITILEDDTGGAVRYQFKCKKGVVITRARYDSTTTNLKNHVTECEKKLAPPAQQISQYATGGAYNKGEVRVQTVFWVARCHRPFKITGDGPFRAIAVALNPTVTFVCDKTVSKDVRRLHKLALPHVSKYLQSYPGFLHLSFDGWTPQNVKSFLGVVVHLAEKGSLRAFLLDFIELRRSHKGVYLAEKLLECLKTFGIEKKIFGLIGDNASNNDKMITELELTLSEAPAGESTRVRCLGHIFNLCTKATFFPFKPTTTRRAGDRLVEIEDEDEDVWDLGEDEVMSDDGEEVDSTEEEPDTGRDVEDLRVVEELASEEVDGAEGGGRFERPLPVVIEEDWAVGRSAFKKVARLTKRIHFSTALSNELQMLCSRLGLKYLTIKRPVATRWNTWATTLGSVLHLRGPLTKLAMSNKKIPSLSTQEWEIIDAIHPIFENFHFFTVYFENNKTPLIYQVIPAFDILDDYLVKVCNDTSLPDIVRVAASRAVHVADKYYAKTDDSVVYRAAMLLHPRWKSTYFDEAGWPEDWKTAAIESIQTCWEKYYKAPCMSEPVPQMSTPAAPSRSNPFFERLNAKPKHMEMPDPMKEWLRSPIQPNVEDPLLWWQEELDRESSSLDKKLCRMAIDILSIPAVSCEMERFFSRSGLMVTKHRHNLMAESTRSATVVGSWYDAGLIPHTEAVQYFNDLAKRKKAEGKEEDNSDEEIL